MPTKLRYILKNEDMGTTMYNNAAIRYIKVYVSPKFILSKEFPEDWYKKITMEKIQYMAGMLPSGWVLQIIREPKNTRHKRSLLGYEI